MVPYNEDSKCKKARTVMECVENFKAIYLNLELVGRSVPEEQGTAIRAAYNSTVA